LRLWSWLPALTPDDADVRSEVWRLGTRHRGEPLQGALEELKAADLTPERARLLRACVRRLQAS